MREQLAELEHIQWMEWSQTIAKELERAKTLLETGNNDMVAFQLGTTPNECLRNALKIITERLNKWKKNWVDYACLDEKTKDFDRVWADKVIPLLNLDSQMKDVTGLEYLEIQIRADGTVVWLNSPDRCIFRACQIKKLELTDNRIPRGENNA